MTKHPPYKSATATKKIHNDLKQSIENNSNNRNCNAQNIQQSPTFNGFHKYAFFQFKLFRLSLMIKILITLTLCRRWNILFYMPNFTNQLV